MKTRPLRGMAALAAGALIALAGCTQNVASLSQDSSGESGTIDSIGFTAQTLNNPFFVTMADAIEANAEDIGATVNAVGANQDVNQQTRQIDTFIQQGVDLILLNAVDSKGIAPAVRRAREAGVPVVALDVGAEGGTAATITSNNRQAGTLACEFLVEKLGGEGNVAIVDGTPITSVIKRVKGCKAVLADHPDINVVAQQKGDNGRAKGLEITSDILTAHPDLDAIFAINDPTGVGAALAAQQADETDLFITAVDGAKAAIKQIESGGLIAATAAQSPAAIGRKGMQIGQKLVAGKKLDKTTFRLPVKLISKENVGSYEPWDS